MGCGSTKGLEGPQPMTDAYEDLVPAVVMAIALFAGPFMPSSTEQSLKPTCDMASPVLWAWSEARGQQELR